ncbi:MAG: hypothetical protein R2749_07565 [Acidimicrobiales bacterium]
MGLGPLTETQYLTELLRHDRCSPADPDHLAALDLAVLRAVQRRSGAWFERVALAAVVGAHPTMRPARRSASSCGHLRRARCWLPAARRSSTRASAADNAGSGQAFGRIVATDVANVARVLLPRRRRRRPRGGDGRRPPGVGAHRRPGRSC